MKAVRYGSSETEYVLRNGKKKGQASSYTKTLLCLQTQLTSLLKVYCVFDRIQIIVKEKNNVAEQAFSNLSLKGTFATRGNQNYTHFSG